MFTRSLDLGLELVLVLGAALVFWGSFRGRGRFWLGPSTRLNPFLGGLQCMGWRRERFSLLAGFEYILLT